MYHAGELDCQTVRSSRTGRSLWEGEKRLYSSLRRGNISQKRVAAVCVLGSGSLPNKQSQMRMENLFERCSIPRRPSTTRITVERRGWECQVQHRKRLCPTDGAVATQRGDSHIFGSIRTENVLKLKAPRLYRPLCFLHSATSPKLNHSSNGCCPYWRQ